MDSIYFVNPEKYNIKVCKLEDLKDFWDYPLGINPKNPGDSTKVSPHVIGWTINLPYDVPVIIPERYITLNGKSNKRERKIKYKDCTPLQQVKYLIEYYLPRVVTPLLERGVGVFELTAKGEVHCHIMAIDPAITDTVDLITLRKKVSQLLVVRKITKGNSRQGSCNYIHYVDCVQSWIEYLQKDQNGKLPVFMFGNCDNI